MGKQDVRRASQGLLSRQTDPADQGPGLEYLHTHCIMPAREGFRSQGTRTQGEQSMKRAVRMLILMVGLVCTYVAVATPMLHADGGPIPSCNPKRGCPQ